MRTCIVTAALLLAFAVSSAAAATPDIDKELSTLAGKLSELVREQQKKKVTVLDFTDLHGSGNDLGKYIAEELTMQLVMSKDGFAVLDRANLRKILAEHKLTASGLVDPENAKKLGQFAGVDALILGTIVPKESTIALNAKIITTDTAEIVGAAKGEFISNTNVQQMLAQTADAATDTVELNASTPAKPRAPQKPFGELQVHAQSFRYSENQGFGLTTLRFIITNTSPTITYGVAYLGSPYSDVRLSNSRNDDFHGVEVQGIDRGGDYVDPRDFTDIPPKSAITVRADNQIVWGGRRGGDHRPYHFEMVILFAEENNGGYSNPRKHIVTIDVK